MLTQYIENPGVRGACVHNTAHWQVTELMGGLAAELLHKDRMLDAQTQADSELTLHDCYPSVFFQGDEANDFLQELSKAQAMHSPTQVDRQLLSNYTEVLN